MDEKSSEAGNPADFGIPGALGSGAISGHHGNLLKRKERTNESGYC
jgi:hypothetical protein